MVELRKVESPANERLSVVVAERLKERIHSGEFQPGDQLPNETALCEEFGVSRITIREAAQMLHALGLVEPTRGRGTFVRQPDPETFLRDIAYFAFTETSSVQHLFEVRGLLEAFAAERAATSGSHEERSDLVEFVESARRLVADPSPEDLAAIAASDMEFHLRIAGLSGNLVLEQLMRRVMQILESVRARSLAVPGQAERSWRQHLAIAAAIRDGNPQLAGARIVEHMEAVKSALLDSESPA